MKMKNLLNISKKSTVILSSFLLASFLIGLVVFMGSTKNVSAVEPCIGDGCISTTVPVTTIPAPECRIDEDCESDGNLCTDDKCVDGNCVYPNNEYQEKESCGTGDCTGTRKRTCLDGSFGPWSDCSSSGNICGDCPGSNGWNDCLFDHYDYTLDKYVSGDIVCSPAGTCDVNKCEYEHKCADHDAYDGPDGTTARCFADCDQDKDCPDHCDGDVRSWGSCNFWPGDCTCIYDDYNCNDDDGWYDTKNTKWVNTDQCNEKEQKEQEYRDYYCSESPSVDCYYDVEGYQWVDTGNTRYEPLSTPCDDGLWCSETDHCDGSGSCVQLTKRDCSDADDCTEDTCDDDKDECVHTHLDVNYPETEKTYGDPKYLNKEDWITSETGITLSAIDYGIDHTQECAKGVDKVYYRHCLDPGCYDGYDSVSFDIITKPVCECPEETPWLEWDGTPFTIPEDSEHCIEYYAVDKTVNDDIVDGPNVEPVKSQCVYVDNQGPDTEKTVGDPKTKWDGKDSYFYPWIKDYCWNGEEDQIDCWKVTLLTPVYMDCVDQTPHPVGAEELCFKVDLDGSDATEKYCLEKDDLCIAGFDSCDGPDGGQMIDGWCCMEETSYTLYFGEETEHNLKYYCTDKLGNEGNEDEEKFKVEGTNFEIQLNKKWNLISVPFVLLSDDPEEIFKDIKDNLDSVWTYDPEHLVCDETDAQGWCVYTANDDPDTLNHIIPGWGYWVMMKDEDILLIGGSLFQPKVTPPTRKMMPSWNLIGYYGTDGIAIYDGPHGEGKEAYCSLYSLVNTGSGLTEWSSLVTYWQPDLIPWKYLTECNHMDPGAGYWIEMDVEEGYAPATACPAYC